MNLEGLCQVLGNQHGISSAQNPVVEGFIPVFQVVDDSPFIFEIGCNVKGKIRGEILSVEIPVVALFGANGIGAKDEGWFVDEIGEAVRCVAI